METRKKPAGVVFLAGMLAVSLVIYAGGSLEPSGPPGPTMKTLDEVEPRIPVQSLSGSANAVYVIDQPGSYYFTGDIVIDVNDKDAIIVEVNDVTIDLMGYTLKGPGSGNGRGIYMWKRSNVEIRNGTVRDFGYFGICEHAAGKGHRVISVRMLSNGQIGICLYGSGHLIKDCTAVENASHGIYAGSGSTVTGNTVYKNNGIGIEVGSGCTVTGNTAYENQNHGIKAGTGSTIIGCTARTNIGNGIYSDGLGTIADNTADRNGGHGIYVNSGAVVARNSCSENTLDGIRGGDGNRIVGNDCGGNGFGGDGAGIHVVSLRNVIEGNTVLLNDRGIDVDSTRNFITKNTATMNTTDYAIAAGNSYGQIINVTSLGSFVNTDPTANFEF